KRPLRLRTLIDHLLKQETGNLFTFGIVIIDNDKFASAKYIYEKYKSVKHQNLSGITYDIEEKQNIALARNKAIFGSIGDYIAFIDDDELPDSNWLLNLYYAINKYKVDGVMGPVCPLFESLPPGWVMRGGFFNRRRFKTGHEMIWEESRTGNVLLRREIFTKNPIWFREEFGSGGEDRDFFFRKINEGYRFIWCDEAVVYEHIPKIRWSIIFMVKRALLRGKVSAYHSRLNMLRFIISIVASVTYLFSLPYLFLISPIAGLEYFMRYLISFFDHMGKVLAVLGINPIKEIYIVSR
ncbi:MAG: glycosyltransferase, partial [Candidatus Aminicenantes bacterium]|nr:glycosyltransferase [Candidatus Aminicenantes bacterium]